MVDITPRMILAMSDRAIAEVAAAFHQAGHHEPTNERYVHLSIADSLANFLRQTIGTDESNRLIVEQMELLKGCIEAASDPEQLGREVERFLRTQAR